MTEDKLNALKDLPPPPPHAEAKAAALAAAMAAFDASAENIADEPQGNGGPASPTHASEQTRRRKMRAHVFYKIAASVAVLTLAVPVSLLFFAYNSADIADQTGGKLLYERLSEQPYAAPPPGSLEERIESAPLPPTAGPNLGLEKKQEFAGVPSQDRRAQSAGTAQPEAAGGSANTNAPAGRVKLLTKPETQAQPLAAAPASMNEKFAEPEPEEYRDRFDATPSSPVKQVTTEPVSTFSIDVDTASYAFIRRALNSGRLPPKDAVRVEEMINYFPYNYPRPETADTPFQPTVTVVQAPWKPSNKLIHIAIKGYDLVARERPRANLVFLIDVSGSMQPQDRLPLVKNAFRMLVEELKPDDTVGIVTYASGSGVALAPTKIARKEKILAAIDALGAGGSTAGAQGIADAYRLAEAHFDKTGINRIILATDGDFNVGISNRDELKGFIERKRQAGIFLSVLGVGQGNYNDALMQVLAQNGNGTAAYVDTLNEARKVLVDEASSTLFPIAKDVKIQLEFNPAQVSEYRLIGYETRALRREDFNNDKVDAGDIGSGHTVTAIYEVTPVSVPKLVDDLRYRKAEPDPVAPAKDGELGFLKLRYKLPSEDASRLITLPITSALEKPEIAAAPEDVRFSVAVAGFGQLLRGAPYLQNYGFDEVLALAQTARGADPYGYRAEFLNLLRLAKSARP
jgi:Ca-activated chloride channel family protein